MKYKNKKRKVEWGVLIWTRAENFSKNSEEKGGVQIWIEADLIFSILSKLRKKGIEPTLKAVGKR